jgi:hypothetical protein
MNKQALAVLVLVNVMLLALLSLVVLTPEPAQAQRLGGAGGEYAMVAGDVNGRQQDAVYIVNLRTSAVAALMFNSGTGEFEPIARRLISDDINETGRRR